MMSKYRDMRFLLVAVFCGFLGVHFSHADEFSDQISSSGAHQFITLGGAAHALAEFCGTYSKSQLAAMKKGQIQKSAQMGISEKQFEDVFSSAVEETKERLKAGSAEQRREACNTSFKLN